MTRRRKRRVPRLCIAGGRFASRLRCCCDCPSAHTHGREARQADRGGRGDEPATRSWRRATLRCSWHALESLTTTRSGGLEEMSWYQVSDIGGVCLKGPQAGGQSLVLIRTPVSNERVQFGTK